MKTIWWLRLLCLFVVIQALSIGRSLIWPELIGFNLPWPASPLNARFVAALYWMGAPVADIGMVGLIAVVLAVNSVRRGWRYGVLQPV